MTNSISVVLPTYNEEKIISSVIKSLQSVVLNLAEIIVVDDDSKDSTALIAGKMPGVIVIVRKKHRKEKGVGFSILEGIKSAKGDVIVWMDADGSHPPKLVPNLIKALENADVAIASRYVGGAGDHRSFLRRIVSKWINLFAQVMLSRKIYDYTTGFVACKKSVIKKIGFDPRGHGEYCIEFLYRCICLGFSIAEVPFIQRERVAGFSKTNSSPFTLMLHGLSYLKKIILLKNKKVYIKTYTRK